MMPLYRLVRIVSLVIFHVFMPIHINGNRDLPDGPVMLVSNHISNWDVIALGVTFKRQIRWMAKVELFKNKLFKLIMDGLGAFSVDRGAADIGAIRTSMQLLKEGEVLGIFPQGTRVKDDDSFEMAGGVSMIALRSHATVVPVHIVGHYRLFRPITVNIGEPYIVPADIGRMTKETLDGISSEIADRVIALKDKSVK